MFDWFAFSRDHFWTQASDKRGGRLSLKARRVSRASAGISCAAESVPNCTNSSTWHPETVPGNFMIARQVWLSGSTPLLCVYVCAHMCVWLKLTSDWVITIIQTGPLPSYLHSASSAVFISTTTELLQSFNYLDNSPSFFFHSFFFFSLPSWVVFGFQQSSPYGSNHISAIGSFLTFFF